MSNVWFSVLTFVLITFFLFILGVFFFASH